jgi:Cys-rich repeat protein
MLKKFNHLAEQAATVASRREFLGRIGRGAVIAAGAVAGYVAFGSEAQAGRRGCTTDAQCPRGRICEAGRCVKGVRPPQACGIGSDNYCLGLVEGAYCQIGTTGGTCVGAPACYCRPSGGRGGGGRRPTP